LRQNLEEHGCKVIATGGIEDHVHVLCEFPPTASVSFIVQQAKGASSHVTTHGAEALNFKWQGAYGAFTVGATGLSRVRDYILGQKAHHSSGSAHPAWEETELLVSGG
jgi:REP element-mobilizing transposase RayT